MRASFYPAHLSDEDCRLADILASGGDERIEPDQQGHNKYGGTPWPREVVAFGSCTASQISQRGWRAAGEALHAFEKRAAETSDIQAASEMGDHIRHELIHLLDARDLEGLEVVLCPSGTDAETIALHIVGCMGPEPIENIIVASREVGTGTVQAAGGRYFSKHVPNGQTRKPGDPVDAELAARTKVHEVRVRIASSDARQPEDVDAEIVGLTREGVARGARVIVHVVPHTKTGLHAPRLATVEQLLRDHGDRVIAIIDAAQGRFSRRGMRRYLSRGFMMITTGSKLFGGPSFSGALLMPRPLASHLTGGGAYPPAFNDYLTPAQLPSHAKSLRASLVPQINLGLLLRWQAAIHEMRAYYQTPSDIRYRVLRFFESQVPAVLSASPYLELLYREPPVFDDTFDRLLESKTTVFSLRVKGGDGQQLDRSALLICVTSLNADIRDQLPAGADDDLRQAAGTLFQVGQSVYVGEQVSGEQDHVIRVALGGCMIADLASNESLGPTFEARLGWLDRQLQLLALKLGWIASSRSMLTGSPR